MKLVPVVQLVEPISLKDCELRVQIPSGTLMSQEMGKKLCFNLNKENIMYWIEIFIFSFLVFGILHYRGKWLFQIKHHEIATKLWGTMMLDIMKEHIVGKFLNTPIDKHIVRYDKNNKIEILIGKQDALIPVDMELFKRDVDLALEEAYSRFVFSSH